jgi:hypothetical protein
MRFYCKVHPSWTTPRNLPKITTGAERGSLTPGDLVGSFEALAAMCGKCERHEQYRVGASHQRSWAPRLTEWRAQLLKEALHWNACQCHMPGLVGLRPVR